jgi:hypothetical protein
LKTVCHKINRTIAHAGNESNTPVEQFHPLAPVCRVSFREKSWQSKLMRQKLCNQTGARPEMKYKSNLVDNLRMAPHPFPFEPYVE